MIWDIVFVFGLKSPGPVANRPAFHIADSVRREGQIAIPSHESLSELDRKKWLIHIQ